MTTLTALRLVAAVGTAIGMYALIRDAVRRTRNAASVWPARARAEALLLACLSPEQRSEYRLLRYFHVTGRSSGRTYRVLRRRTGSVQALDVFGRPSDAYCSVLPEGAPIEDQMLAQKLKLETDELGFLELAGHVPFAR